MDFVQIITENTGENWINKVFGKLKTDKERFRIIYNFEKTRQPLIDVLSNVQEIYRRKNAEMSQKARFDAERILKEGKMQKALLLYSQSVLRAPAGQIARGILITLNEENRASVSFRLAEKLLAGKMKLGDLERDKRANFVAIKKLDRNALPLIDGEPDSKVPSVSQKIAVKEKEGMGRYVTANKEIKTGEKLVVEAPYAACLLPKMFGTHCHHCFERLVSPVGCPDCSNVAFCKPDCRNAALSSYHKYECKYLDLLLGSGMSILSHTAFRMITQNNLDRCLEIYKDRSKEKVYSLCTNASIRQPIDFFQRTLMAAFLLRCLQKSGYFRATDRNRILPSEEEYQVGELLLFHLQMLQFNAHEIYETESGPAGPIKGSKVTYIGVAIYPTVALFNHQCYPAVMRYFVGKDIVIRASRPVEPQQIVSENYGPIFTRKCLQERQRSLSSRYWFTCNCDACKFNWPTMDGEMNDFSRQIKCPNKTCTHRFTLPMSKETLNCPKCSEIICLKENIKLLQWCEDQYKVGFKEVEANNSKKSGRNFLRSYRHFSQNFLPPTQDDTSGSRGSTKVFS
ncbi:hypothetical protein NQ317_004394 [Molorchus minor]|uniref:MYND-type domain-containing protein n=1 Tax=Molorchus minor TaxID=1323400 RepID=A0ABQ9IZ24_9CUCU|nr:hypothetical protein NQ317_004394 [Molorchus minor]